MYLLTAVADSVRIEDSEGSLGKRIALKRLWGNMVNKKMYLTGGIGSQKDWEGFGIDYFLPSGTDEGGCYAETCAGIGVMMLAERLLQVSKILYIGVHLLRVEQIDLDGSFADIMELCFYNNVSTAMSANGKRFTYVNQLASSNTDLSKRSEWFTCACCPPNISRLLGYIGGYLWSHKIDETRNSADINIHLYSAATIKLPMGDTEMELEQRSNWPWDGHIEFCLRKDADVAVTIKLRIPRWSSDWKVKSSHVFL